jgi:hypothetical protein
VSVLDVSTRIQARALQLDPVKVLLFVVMLPIFLLGFSLRFVWLVVAFAIAAAQDGWQVADTEMAKRRSR